MHLITYAVQYGSISFRFDWFSYGMRGEICQFKRKIKDPHESNGYRWWSETNAAKTVEKKCTQKEIKQSGDGDQQKRRQKKILQKNVHARRKLKRNAHLTACNRMVFGRLDKYGMKRENCQRTRFMQTRTHLDSQRNAHYLRNVSISVTGLTGFCPMQTIDSSRIRAAQLLMNHSRAQTQRTRLRGDFHRTPPSLR